MINNINNTIDSTIRTVKDFTVRSDWPLSRMRKNIPENKATTMIMSSRITALLNSRGPDIYLKYMRCKTEYTFDYTGLHERDDALIKY